MARILVAEDDPTFQKLIYKIIDKMGHTPFVSPNGKHALETLQANNNIDLLISDLLMPEMDGRQLIQTLRGHSRFSTLPIIITSAIIKISEISDLLNLGASSFLGKPINKADLEELINRYLHKSADTE